MKPAWGCFRRACIAAGRTQNHSIPKECNGPVTVENWLTNRSCFTGSKQAAPLRKLTPSRAPKAITARLPGDRNGAFRQLSRA
jgi:hypothetical protein